MKIRSKLFRCIRLVTLLLVTVVVMPFGFSRIASSWRRVTVHSFGDGVARDNEDSGIRIACYNIAHGRGLATSNWQGGTPEERLNRLEQIADVLRTLDADVVVLNEVDFDSSWSLSKNQARYLAKRAGYSFWAEQRNLDFRVLAWKWRFGNAVLSKYPILQAGVVDLPGFSGIETLLAGKKRGVDCTIDVNGQHVRVLGVHLCHRSEAVRAQSAQLITDMTSPMAVPTIVAGDLNSSPTGFSNSQSDPDARNAVDILDASSLFQRHPLHLSGGADELTFHSTEPKWVIDWILVPKTCEVIDYRVGSSTLSDHRPVVAEVLLKLPADRGTFSGPGQRAPVTK